MAVTPTSAIPTTQNTSGSNTGTTTLGKDDFLKLLVAQMQYQDPMSPQDPTQSMQQMTLFTIAEQEMNANQEIQAMHRDESISQSASLIGKDVTYKDADGNSVTATVDHVEVSATNGAMLALKNNDSITYAQVLSVSDPAAASSSAGA